ncbi:hypothetical protein N0V83_010371 [Neocucurbitaria cava]|uniref:Translation initiation factor eIF4e n=1 Tax=Neocucurbitaria cava TaxID=798079 RepID=A0A9W9CGH5_9PLEO|nr:hypothetical protein N0V83_010371 [Neocucurbitaria cava]
MTEAARLIGMLRASAPHSADSDKRIDNGQSRLPNTYQVSQIDVATTHSRALPVSLLEGLIHAPEHGVTLPNELLSVEYNDGLNQVLNTLNTLIARDSPKMAGRFPVLSTSNLPHATPEEQSATASPARGTAMLNSIFKSVRVPEFRFKWMFWAEKGQQATPKDKAANSEEYASRPKPLGDQIISVKEFYQHFNNIPVESLKLRDSIHLFHLGIKPVWEDPRNSRGGAWYFKISKDVAAQFWHEMCLLAVGDILQSAIETKRDAFNDDICGITYSVRWNAVQIAVWNRDAENEAGREKLLATILAKLSPELQPKKEDSYWYKAHKEHKGFIEQQ